mgnify:FL=1
MKVIEYNNKKYKLPCDVVYDDVEMVEVENYFSGQKCMLPRFARGVYVAIKNAEDKGQSKKMQKLLSWFSRNFTKEYFVLLD